jgi:soluble lytic murein transglycosylase-like protein
MDYVSIITLVSKQVGVSASLMLAICTHESGLRNIHNENDHGTPSIGICQLKVATAQLLGFKGTRKNLEDPMTNAKWAARYLKMQLERYDNDGCKAVAAYNSGSFAESKKKPGYPRNLRYVKEVQELIVERNINMLLDCNKFAPRVVTSK